MQYNAPRRRNPPPLYEGTKVMSKKEHWQSFQLNHPIFIDNQKILIELYNKHKSMFYALKEFKQIMARDGQKAPTPNYITKLVQSIKNELAIQGDRDEMLRETLHYFDKCIQVADDQLDEEKNIFPMLKALEVRAKTVGLVKEVPVNTTNVNINPSLVQNKIENNITLQLGKKRLDDYLDKLPQDKRDAIKQLASGIRQEGAGMQMIEMKDAKSE